MTKKEKLSKLDELVLDRMIDIMADEDDNAIQALASLSTPMNYLKNNQVVAEKAKSTIEEDVKKRIEEAKERRKKKINQ